MTFEEWKETRHMNGIYWGDLKAAWDAAIEAEREACAMVCESQATEPECPERAQYCADAIRMRSNVEAQARAEAGEARCSESPGA